MLKLLKSIYNKVNNQKRKYSNFPMQSYQMNSLNDSLIYESIKNLGSGAEAH